jgi:hypothetical protein
MKKVALFVSIVLCFSENTFAQENGGTPGVFAVSKNDTLLMFPVDGSLPLLVLIRDAHGDTIVRTMLDSVIVFSRTECVYPPCTVSYVYFRDKKMQSQTGKVLFVPRKSDHE